MDTVPKMTRGRNGAYVFVIITKGETIAPNLIIMLVNPIPVCLQNIQVYVFYYFVDFS